jgi:hypothetical protein
MHEPVGYTADADLWCEACAKLVFDRMGDDGILRTVGMGNAVDHEGNDVGALFTWDESGDTPDHCGRCGEMLDTSLSPTAVAYVEDAVRDYLESGDGNRLVIEEWIERAYPWAGMDDELAERFIDAS